VGSKLSDERGELTSTVILLAVTVQMVLLVFHAGLVYHGRQVASAAAQEALAAAQLAEGDAGAGQAAGQNVLNLSAGLFSTSSVSVSRGADTVTVTVNAEIDTTVFPVMNTVSITVSGPAERFVAEVDRR